MSESDGGSRGELCEDARVKSNLFRICSQFSTSEEKATNQFVGACRENELQRLRSGGVCDNKCRARRGSVQEGVDGEDART